MELDEIIGEFCPCSKELWMEGIFVREKFIKIFQE